MGPFRIIPLTALLIVAFFLLTGCNFQLEHDPAKTVTIEITGLREDTAKEQIQESLKGMTDGSNHLMTTTSSGDRTTIQLSPVTDVDAFAKKINFGHVASVEGRTVNVEYVE